MVRLDKALVERMLVSSRTRAQRLIKEGKVALNGEIVCEPDQLVGDHDVVSLTQEDFPWVSRGGLKLAYALTHWNIDPNDKTVLDIGASTGGFTEVLLTHGACRVYALDVGHGQLAEKLRKDPRVVNMEGTHIADVSLGDFPEPFPLIVIDVSFISLTKVLSKARELLSLDGCIVALVKPQFEVGRDRVGKGVVRDETLHTQVLRDIRTFAEGLGFTVSGQLSSPIEGGDGNKEFFLLFTQANGL